MSQHIVQDVGDQLFLEMMQYILACRNLGRGAMWPVAAHALVRWQKVSQYRHFDLLLETSIIVMKVLMVIVAGISRLSLGMISG